MNCKYCNAELVDGKTFCPACGKEQTETEETAAESVVETAEETVPVVEAVETEVAEPAAESTPFDTDFEAPAQEAEKEAPKASAGKITAAVVAGVLVIAILIGLLASGLGGAMGNEPTIAPTAGTVAATEPVQIPSNGDPASALCKESYTVSDDEALAAADVVVATMGDVELTNGELQAYYWMEVFAFLQEYSSYAAYFGLDMTQPLDTQLCELGEQPMSWQQFFLDSAIYSWKSYQSMAMEAEKANYQLPAERQAELDNLPKELQTTAETGGFESVEDLVAHNVGAGCSLEDYFSYINTYYKGLSYYYDLCDKIAPTEDEILSYFKENEASYTESGITMDSGVYVDIRHVLLQPEGGETGEDGYPVFTEEAWEACRQKAEALYNKWQEGDKSEESFAQLAKENSVDGNASAGGLYENVYEGRMVPEFDSWCFDEARQVGDHGLVKTAYGYHIMFFSGSHKIWQVNAEADLINSIAYDLIPDSIEKYPAEVDYSAMKLAFLQLA